MQTDDPCARTHAHARDEMIRTCEFCGKIGDLRYIDFAEHTDIIRITVLDTTVRPNITRFRYVCYECYLWEAAIEEQCNQLIGHCPDSLRQAAMQRYLDQGRWLSLRDLQEIASEHNTPYIRRKERP